MRNEDLDWDDYKNELLCQIDSDQTIAEILLSALFNDDFFEVKQHMEFLEQEAINAVLSNRRG